MSVGRADVDRFLDEISWRDLQELRAYVNLRGLTETRADLRMAYMLAVLCRKFGANATPQEFMYLPEQQDDFGDIDTADEFTDEEFTALAFNLGARRI